ncbi:DUF4402 domain-containing protein [Litoribacter populi]|uniref:DUF4402 domain-containing protein n=1 Tax=Litoribacter populi TaxID=2598460 RepID=UPI00117CAA42|nr:DUF4402 domain-containing protein [Litoribacter populi]
MTLSSRIAYSFTPQAPFRGFWWVLGLLLIGLATESHAQVQVFAEQPASFGSFVVGYGGGSIHISEEEERVAEGEVILLNQGSEAMPPVFAVEAPLGAVIHIQLGPEVILKGSNGGEAILRMHYPYAGSTYISQVAPPDRNYIAIPVSLTLNGRLESIPGNYSGSLSITVLEE